MVPDLDLAAIRRYCEHRIPPDARGQVRVEAQVTQNTSLWMLYWRDRNVRWHRHTSPAGNVLGLLDEIDHDATGIFWG